MPTLRSIISNFSELLKVINVLSSSHNNFCTFSPLVTKHRFGFISLNWGIWFFSWSSGSSIQKKNETKKIVALLQQKNDVKIYSCLDKKINEIISFSLSEAFAIENSSNNKKMENDPLLQNLPEKRVSIWFLFTLNFLWFSMSFHSVIIQTVIPYQVIELTNNANKGVNFGIVNERNYFERNYYY